MLPFRCLVSSAVPSVAALMTLALLGTGVVAAPAVAQDPPASSKPAAAPPTQPASPSPAASPAAPSAANEAASHRPPTPPRKATPPRPADKALSAECVWTGERVVSLLARDDADMAERFVAFYDRFGCPMYRLGEAFSCVARSPVAQTTARSAEGASLADIASSCWVDPAQEFPVPDAAAPPAGDQPAAVTPMQQQ